MSVQVFKDGRSIFVEPEALKNHIASGWSVQDPRKPVPNAPKKLDIPVSATPEEAEAIVLAEMGIKAQPPKKRRGRPPKAKQ